MQKIKEEIKQFLLKNDFEVNPASIHKYPPKKVVNILFSLLVTTDENLKNRVVKAFGQVVSGIAEADIESARIIMRRLMLSLNDESGGIGWNSPEAMGEIMARNKKLAEEYHKILISYAAGGGNELEFDGLQKSVFSGLRRLAEVYPELVKDVKTILN